MSRPSEPTATGHTASPGTGRRNGPGRPSRAPERRAPVFPESSLVVRPWPDPVLDALGHDPRSLYVEQYWLAVLGPSSLFLLRGLARRLEAEPEGFGIDPERWAAELGLGSKGGVHGPLWRSIERSCRFGAARRDGPTLSVRRRLPPLTSRQVKRLAPHLQEAHAEWQELQLRQPRRRTITHWSDRRAVPPPGPESPGPGDQ